uniref:Uncharacterized protein n=1 Tax=Zea mays TaxID=4577 RepID=C4J4B1_MAIZE|nr:unknown [Zea mays]
MPNQISHLGEVLAEVHQGETEEEHEPEQVRPDVDGLVVPGEEAEHGVEDGPLGAVVVEDELVLLHVLGQLVVAHQRVLLPPAFLLSLPRLPPPPPLAPSSFLLHGRRRRRRCFLVGVGTHCGGDLLTRHVCPQPTPCRSSLCTSLAARLLSLWNYQGGQGRLDKGLELAPQSDMV